MLWYQNELDIDLDFELDFLCFFIFQVYNYYTAYNTV